MEHLPAELIFHIAGFLEAADIARLQLASRRLLQITRDNKLWRPLCFADSQAEALRRRRELIFGAAPAEPRVLALQSAASSLTQEQHGGNPEAGESASAETQPAVTSNANGSTPTRSQAIASWDPSHPGEEVDWYQEYIHRHGPISFERLQQPFSTQGGTTGRLEPRGMACFADGPEGESHQDIGVVAPLEDGSVCLWDLWGHSFDSGGRRGRVLARSRPGLLSTKGGTSIHGEDGPASRAEMTSTGVVECVSVDHQRQRAYFAVQSSLNEVDLNTLQNVSQRKFPFSISSISAARYPIPLTVGTSLSLHLHDPRERSQDIQAVDDGLDLCEPSFTSVHARLLLNDTITSPYYRPSQKYAPLFQPGPVSILHLPSQAGVSGSDAEIYVAGRFPSILHYDRRYWPRLHRTIHSGARLSGLAWLSYPSQSLEPTSTGHSLVDSNGAASRDTQLDSALIACGEYNGKGSLELYGLAWTAAGFQERPVFALGNPKIPNFKNRHTASRSKLLSVANHGTRLVFSDGDGNIKWMERDGCVDVRQWNLNSVSTSEEQSRGLFAASDEHPARKDPGEVARKILSVQRSGDKQRSNKNDLLVWSGERIGRLSFSGSPSTSSEDDEEGQGVSAKEALRLREEKIYGQTMRRALERQADEVRFVRGLGLGAAPALGS